MMYRKSESKNQAIKIFPLLPFVPLCLQTTSKPIGEEALLTCEVAANPSEKLVFEWRFQGQLLTGQTEREIKVRACWDEKSYA